MRSFFALIKLNFLLQLRNPLIIVLMTASPLILMPFLTPAYKTMLISQGYPNATGAEQAVPGMAILFSFLATQVIVQAFYDEYLWGMWARLRSTAASQANIVLSKALVVYVVQVLQLLAVISLGSVLYDFQPNGSWAALIMTILSFSAVLTAFSVTLSLWIVSEKTALSIANLVGMLMSGIGGALGSVHDFPDWAQHIAKLSPVYWAMESVHKISLDSAGLHEVSHNIGILLLFLAIFVIASITKCIIGLDNRKTE